MKKQTGDTYQPSEYAKSLCVSEAKVGKTVFAIAQALGVFPGQKFGGIVDNPKNLHVIALDSGAVTGAQAFLKLCDAPKEAFGFNIYNLQDDVRKVSTGEDDWDYSLYNALIQVIRQIRDEARGTPAVIMSSLTTMAVSLERALAGPPGAKQGAGMDQAKWSDFARQVSEIRNLLQQDSWHAIWEAHIYKPPPTGQNKEEQRSETLQVSGKAGYNFPNNVEQVFRIRRLFGETYEGTKIDQMYLDTRPAMEFISGGRMFTENLDPREYDMTLAFYKLGLKVGRWGHKATKKAKK